MRMWSHVLELAHVNAPLPVPRIKRSSQHKVLLRMAPRWFQKELIELRLTIVSKCSHITQVADEIALRRHAKVGIRIDTSVQRTYYASVVFLLQFVCHLATGKRKNQIEGRKL